MRKIVGVNVMETAVFLFLGGRAMSGRNRPPSSTWPAPMWLTSTRCPRPLILTGIVVSVSVTALSLALVVRIHRQYGTIDADEIAAIRSAEDV